MSRELPQMMSSEGTGTRANPRLPAVVGIRIACPGSCICTPALNHSIRKQRGPRAWPGNRVEQTRACPGSGRCSLTRKGSTYTGTWPRPRGIHCDRPVCSSSESDGRQAQLSFQSESGCAALAGSWTGHAAGRVVGEQLHGQCRAVARSAWPLPDGTGVRTRSLCRDGDSALQHPHTATWQGRVDPVQGTVRPHRRRH